MKCCHQPRNIHGPQFPLLLHSREENLDLWSKKIFLERDKKSMSQVCVVCGLEIAS